MALGILAEAVARIEHKLDLVLKALKFLDKTQLSPMHFSGNVCPVCNQLIDYQIDLTHNVVTRKCGCKTGKQPSSIPLTPITGVVPNAGFNSAADSSQAGLTDSAPNSSRRKGR